MKIVTVVGARPQFIKAAPVSQELRRHFQEVLVNTGQHYDAAMSDVFFDQLSIPTPDYNLAVGSGTHAEQTGRMLIEVEKVLLQEKPDWVLVYGDTNSTMAGALAAAKLHIPVAHVEAGLRSFNRQMPEEINRVMTDHLSQLCFAPTDIAVANLSHEGIASGVHQVGDVMCDTVRMTLERTDTVGIRRSMGLQKGRYYVLTVHRPQNADDPAALGAILTAAARSDVQVIFPVHPRTRKHLFAPTNRAILEGANNIRLLEPVGYQEMLAFEQGAAVVLTDSGGVQKEALMLGVPCVTLRTETEWAETVETGWNVLAGTDPERILAGAKMVSLKSGTKAPAVYGDGHSAQRIAAVIAAHHA